MKWAVVVLLAGLMAANCILAQDDLEKDPFAKVNNAAYHYWRAAALMTQPENLAANDFLDIWADSLPLSALAEEQDFFWILETDLTSGVADALHDGATCSECEFGANVIRASMASSPDLVRFRGLARRARLLAHAAEILDSPEQACQIRGDIIQMGYHVGEGRTMLFALVGRAIAQIGLSDVRFGLDNHPTSEATTKLLQQLDKLSSLSDSLGNIMTVEAEFLQHTAEPMPSDDDLDRSLASLREDGPWSLKGNVPYLARVGEPFMRQLRDIPQADRSRVYSKWTVDYQEAVQPFTELAGTFAAKRAQIVTISKAAANKGKDEGNPLLVSLGDLPLLFDDFSFTDAQVNMTKLLIASEIFRAENQTYPATQDRLIPYFSDGLPTDPFTGAAVIYELVEGVPRVSCQPPPEVVAEHKNWKTAITLGESARLQEAALKRYLEEKAKGK